MLLNYTKTIAYRCGECGRSYITNIGVFSLSGHGAISYACECSSHCVSIKATKDSYIIQVDCSVCSETHTFKLSHTAFWGKPLIALHCVATSLPTLFIGDAENVTIQLEEADRELEELIDDLEESDIVPTFDEMIMIQIIDHIHEIADAGKLNCHCGSSEISFSLESGNVNLVCDSCGASEIVLADSQSDLDVALKKKSITLKPSPRHKRTRQTRVTHPD